MRFPLLAVLLILPAFAGCLQGAADVEYEPTDDSAPSKAAAGARDGVAPAAPSQSYRVAATDGEAGETTETVAHPLRVSTNAAREPLELSFPGTFEVQDCMGIGIRPLTANSRFTDLREHLREGDVYAYEISLKYENKQDSWAEIHMVYGLGNTIQVHTDPVSEIRGIVDINFSGQGFRVDEDDVGFVNVMCWYGQTTAPIPYTLDIKFTFAENAVPAESPFLVTVPEGATKLIVTGVPIDGTQGVNSHYRLFGPDDQLVCECGLGSMSEASYIELAAPGDYVILVDHTANGFVALALDVPPTEELRALDTEWVRHKVFTAQGEAPLDTVVQLELDQVPLFMNVFSSSEDGAPSAGVGKKTRVEVTNSRGTPVMAAWGGYVTHRIDTPIFGWDQWWGLWPADWDYSQDHHAYSPGAHNIHITSEALRGDVFVIVKQYVR